MAPRWRHMAQVLGEEMGETLSCKPRLPLGDGFFGEKSLARLEKSTAMMEIVGVELEKSTPCLAQSFWPWRKEGNAVEHLNDLAKDGEPMNFTFLISSLTVI